MSGGFHAVLRALRRIDEAREVEDGFEVHVRRDPIEHAVRSFRRGSVHRAAVVEWRDHARDRHDPSHFRITSDGPLRVMRLVFCDGPSDRA